MTNGEPNETGTPGTETNTPVKNNNEPTPKPVEAPSSLEEARAINKEKKELLDREEKLQKRREDLHAEQMVGGHTQAGQEPVPPKEETNEEFTERFERGEVDLTK